MFKRFQRCKFLNRKKTESCFLTRHGQKNFVYEKNHIDFSLDLCGSITLRTVMQWSTWWTAQIGKGWRRAERSWSTLWGNFLFSQKCIYICKYIYIFRIITKTTLYHFLKLFSNKNTIFSKRFKCFFPHNKRKRYDEFSWKKRIFNVLTFS